MAVGIKLGQIGYGRDVYGELSSAGVTAYCGKYEGCWLGSESGRDSKFVIGSI